MAKQIIFNIFTGTLDYIGQSASDIVVNDARYLKLDQTVSQTVVNGAPQFNEGIVIKENKRIYLDGL